MVSEQVRKMTQIHWIMLFFAIFIAWIFLYLLSVPSELRLLSKIYGANFFNEFCIITPDVGVFFKFFDVDTNVSSNDGTYGFTSFCCL